MSVISNIGSNCDKIWGGGRKGVRVLDIQYYVQGKSTPGINS